MHLIPLVRDLAVILGIGSLSALLFQRLRQPVVLGYLICGIIVGPHTPPFSWVTDVPGIQTWSELGVIFLMFSLGLEFSLKKLMNVGATALISGPLEALFMLGLGFAGGKLYGWSTYDSVFLGAALAISSTAIIIKTFDEMGLKKARFAEIVFGVLVLEDLVGILLLVVLSTLGDGNGLSVASFSWTLAKLVLVVGCWMIVGYFFLARLIGYIGKKSNDETLTLLSLGLCLASVVLTSYFHYSAALGAFLMGSTLAGSSQAHRIELLIKPLRDVFAAVFFVSIGMLLNPADLVTYWQPILWVTVITVVGKVLSTSIGVRITGNPTNVAVRAGAAMGQIGEFSFVIAALGVTLGLVSPFLYPIIVSVSILTTFGTPYFIRLSQRYFP